VLVFVSGKCVVTGAKGMEEVRRAVEFIWPVLRLYSTRIYYSEERNAMVIQRH